MDGTTTTRLHQRRRRLYLILSSSEKESFVPYVERGKNVPRSNALLAEVVELVHIGKFHIGFGGKKTRRTTFKAAQRGPNCDENAERVRVRRRQRKKKAKNRKHAQRSQPTFAKWFKTKNGRNEAPERSPSEPSNFAFSVEWGGVNLLICFTFNEFWDRFGPKPSPCTWLEVFYSGNCFPYAWLTTG